jgi:hypothetical protein
MRVVQILAALGLLIGTADAQKNWPTPRQQELDYATWVSRNAGTPFKALIPGAYPDSKVWVAVLSIECEGESVATPQNACRLATNKAQVSSTGPLLSYTQHAAPELEAVTVS